MDDIIGDYIAQNKNNTKLFRDISKCTDYKFSSIKDIFYPPKETFEELCLSTSKTYLFFIGLLRCFIYVTIFAIIYHITFNVNTPYNNCINDTNISTKVSSISSNIVFVTEIIFMIVFGIMSLVSIIILLYTMLKTTRYGNEFPKTSLIDGIIKYEVLDNDAKEWNSMGEPITSPDGPFDNIYPE